MKVLRNRRSRKLNNQFSHVYTNMLAGQKGIGKGSWIPVYNRLVKDLLLDLQDSQAFPSNGYLHEQMHQLQNQAKRISEVKKKSDNIEVNWDSVFAAVKDSDLIWENKLDQQINCLVTKCFALINDTALNQAEVAAILSSLGGTQLSDHQVIHVNCISLVRITPFTPYQETQYERPVKRLMLGLVADEMKACSGESVMAIDDRTTKDKIYDWFLMKKI